MVFIVLCCSVSFETLRAHSISACADPHIAQSKYSGAMVYITATYSFNIDFIECTAREKVLCLLYDRLDSRHLHEDGAMQC